MTADNMLLERPPTLRQQAGAGPATLAEVMVEVEEQAGSGDAERLRPMATGFTPLDDILNGGLRPGELMIVGGPFGVGKTIWGLQVARNVVQADPNNYAMYVCYEHDRAHLMSRLLCMETAERGFKDDALTLRRIADFTLNGRGDAGLISRLRTMPRYAAVLDAMELYAQRLYLVKASGDHSTLDYVRRWVEDALDNGAGSGRFLLVVDYLQKIPVPVTGLDPETETTTILTQGLKETAMALGIEVIAIAAADRPGLKARRMRLADLRGSSALQYEADVGIILNNKYAILSREHMIYNPAGAEAYRNWVVMSVEKNRAGRNAIDMEYSLDAAHFRIVPQGNFVRERLVDDKITMD